MVMSLFHSVSDLIGHTPLLQLHKLDTGPCSLFLKLENQNPGGSIKDRVALSMINEAERQGKLAPGGTIIEATAGNTGLGLALIAAQKNYRLILVVPDKMSREKIFHLRALGATVLLTRSDVNKGHPAYYQDYARRLADETPGAFYIDQFNNDANPLAHATSTAPELYQQLEGDIDAIVVGVGSGGTLMGTARRLKADHAVRAVAVEPDAVPLLSGGTVKGAHHIEGIGDDFIPAVVDQTLVDGVMDINDLDAIAMAAKFGRVLGLGVGISSGANFLGSVIQNLEPGRKVATVFADDSKKYLTTMLSNPPAETAEMWSSRIELLDYEPVETL